MEPFCGSFQEMRKENQQNNCKNELPVSLQQGGLREHFDILVDPDRFHVLMTHRTSSTADALFSEWSFPPGGNFLKCQLL